MADLFNYGGMIFVMSVCKWETLEENSTLSSKNLAEWSMA